MAKTPPPTPGAAGDPDPSMDDILASIRRILDDDQGAKAPDDGVLMLDPSMMVAEPPAASEPVEPPQPLVVPPSPSVPPPVSPPVPQEKLDGEPVIDEQTDLPPVSREASIPMASSLVAPEAAAAAANSVGALMRTLAAERSAAVSRGGATIEDLVREEMRPLLKSWLDAHLPPIVERLVQAEIERVVARQAG